MMAGNKSGMRAEYDFSKGVRGKYAMRAAQGTNLVLLEPDVYKIFRDSKSVNEALRMLIKAGAHASRKAAQPTKKKSA